MRNKQTFLWIMALVIGFVIGLLDIQILNTVMDFIAKIYTRLFQLLAVPTIAVAVFATLTMLGNEKNTGRIFGHVIKYTLFTTFLAAIVAVAIYYIIAPTNLPKSLVESGLADVPKDLNAMSYGDYLMEIVPNNIIKPFLDSNVLSILLITFVAGIGLSKLPDSDNKASIVKFVLGLQELLFLLIRALVRTFPLGIAAFSVQLAVQVNGGMAFDSIGKYTLVVLLSNVIQMFIILPLFLLGNKINPIKAIQGMSPALLTAFFTKSSAATLPLTIETAEERMKVSPRVSRFVLPICTTINMNGCAAFIAITSIFVMQNSGLQLSWFEIFLWIMISVISAIGNAGVPMGCYFLTLSLMSGMGGAIGIMGVILPIYTIIDMVETSENVWSDSCIAIVTNQKVKP
ncbi:dicarboxylate/amino acid:cation symporter [Phocaeicola paurosaccharolyticus]|uniref:dicarboxylate/amino acid:cation symporter n=1 Tax=Phocaeicola paurosaccharolyticus TaxID=732242 RepID=UPI002FE33E93